MRTRSSALIAAILLAVTLLAIYVGRRIGARTVGGVVLLSEVPGALPSDVLVDNLRGDDPAVVRESLAVLKKRHDPDGINAALPLLRSDSPYVWLSAALYLGSFDRTEPVPYLIKGLRHNAERAYPECERELTSITGQHYGEKFTEWRHWWEKSNPSLKFDFDGNLGK